MATISEAIRRMIYQYFVEGADKVRQTQEEIAASTTKTDKASLSLEKSFGNLERRYISTVRSQQDYQKIQEKVNAAVAQNPALQERANAVLAAASQQYNQATGAQKALAVATSGVNAQLVAMSAGAGPVGTFLAALGPAGFAASVGLGVVSAGLNRLVEGAERAGDKAIELKKFADVTGLTVQQIKGLTQAGGRMGIDTDEIKTSLEKFTIGLNEAREGTGSLYEQVRKINPELANQLALAPNAAKAWDILAKAIQGATDASQRNALARAAFGRGGIETGLVAVESATQGGIDNLAKASDLTKDWIDQTAKLRNENVQLEKATQAAMDAAYALPVLRRQNEYLKTLKEIADLTLKGGGFKAPGAEDYGAPFANYLSPPVAPLSQRGPSEGAMQAQEEAEARREVVKTIQEQQKEAARLANLEKERIGYLGEAATEQEKLNAKTLELNALLINNTISQETYNRALAAAELPSDRLLRNLQQEAQLIDASSDAERDRIKARQTYDDLIKKQVSSDKASAIASQQLANANKTRMRAEDERSDVALRNINTQADAWKAYQEGTISWSVANDEAGNVLRRNEAAADDAAAAMNRYDKALQDAYVDAQFFTKLPLTFMIPLMNPYEMGKTAWDKGGQLSQFNPAGYTSTTAFAPPPDVETQINKMMAASGGNLQSAVLQQIQSGILTKKDYLGLGGGTLDTDKIGVISRAIDLLPQEQQAGSIQALLGQATAAPASLQTAELIKQLNDKLQQLAQATDENTSATSAMTDVLSPFYSSDPRRTHLGFRAFAGGGIMSQYGELPIRRYQGGGMATSPQVAVYGEGSVPEAYVPVPSGRIPVEIKGAANSNHRPVNVTINVMGNADGGTVAALKSTAFQQAQSLRRVVG